VPLDAGIQRVAKQDSTCLYLHAPLHAIDIQWLKNNPFIYHHPTHKLTKIVTL
jgi:hypothetical protein